MSDTRRTFRMDANDRDRLTVEATSGGAVIITQRKHVGKGFDRLVLSRTDLRDIVLTVEGPTARLVGLKED